MCPTKTTYNAVSDGEYSYTVNIGTATGNNGYGSWLSCDLTFTFPNSACFYFQDFDLQVADTKTELCRDYVQMIVDGNTWGPYCGTTNPFTAVNNTGEQTITLQFRSDLDTFGSGLTLVIDDCG